MKIKKGLGISTVDFWGDISEGYLELSKILENKNDVLSVENAIEVLKEFQDSCEEQIEDFMQ